MLSPRGVSRGVSLGCRPERSEEGRRPERSEGYTACARQVKAGGYFEQPRRVLDNYEFMNNNI
jgi:hypothetical protein